MRVRANAGTGSFRRKQSLRDNLQLASQRLKQLKREANSDAQRLSSRQRAAKQRAATERAKRAKDALETLENLQKDIDKRKRSKKERAEHKRNARASTTDPEVKKMKMAKWGIQSRLQCSVCFRYTVSHHCRCSNRG